MTIIEGTVTAVTPVRPDADSLRTTIPAWVVKHMKLTKGDRLDWTLDKKGGVWIVRVDRTEGA